MPALRPTLVIRAAERWKDYDWPRTLNLPKSAFPARASVAELAKYRQRCSDDLYAWQRANRPDENGFVLHDGPPYANGPVHVGHALNKVLKDLILRWELAKGRKVHYWPGWDCHGLPIELKALQQARTKQDEANSLADAPRQEAAGATSIGMTAAEIRRKARELATETIEVQKKSFREWGVMGEWDQPYKTMDQPFEIRQLGVFREMVRKGLISRHRRPVYWSPSSRTALAEAELEYDDNHTCTAAFVKMPLVRLPKVLQAHDAVKLDDVCALIWTTTPWTLPANKAIAVHNDIQYAVVELHRPGSSTFAPEPLLVAEDRLEHVLSFLPDNITATTIVGGISGSQLADGTAAASSPFLDEESPILSADFVTATSGTGLVHMAPGHGMEDYQVCQKYGVGPAIAPVDDDGRYTAEAFPTNHEGGSILTGLDVQTEGVEAVLKLLREPSTYLKPGVHDSGSSLILASHPFTHKNPIDWRTKQPVVVRATAQWFADTSALEGPASSSLDDVTFIPETGKNRLNAFLGGRSQWCISRQRAWGVPIPALYHMETGEACITDVSIEHIISVLEKKGTDAWFEDAVDDPAWLHSSLEAGQWIRGKDTMDVWFDSGTTWTTLRPRPDGRAISDVYVEGTDQHRGWFQSSLLTHVAVQDAKAKAKAPYAKLITHGFTLDADGRKMSKSLGNVIAPDQIITGSLLPPIKERNQRGKKKTETGDSSALAKPKLDSMGPDALRLWVASSDYTRDVTIAIPLLQEVQNSLQKYRVTFKWLLGVLDDYDPANASEPNKAALSWADKALLSSLARTSKTVYQAYGEYTFHKAVKDIGSFVNNNLSAFAFEVYKDRLYTGRTAERRRTQAVLHSTLQELMIMLGPAVPHLIEEVWDYMPAALRERQEHPLRVVWTAPFQQLTDSEEEETRKAAQYFDKLSAAVKLAQEDARKAGKVKSGLACAVEIHLPQSTESALSTFIERWDRDGELADLLVVSQVSVVRNEEGSGKGGDLAWRFQQAVESPNEADACKVVVLPPEGVKCIRCWKYTADEADVPCGRCQDVLLEKESSQGKSP